MSGLGTPRGPEFHSPSWASEPLLTEAPVHSAAKGRRFPAAALAALAVVGLSAGAGGAAGYFAGRDDDAEPATAAPLPQGNVPADLVGAAARVLPSVVSVQVRTGQGGASGSGFVFDNRGHIVTNNHVVAAGRGGSVSIVGADGQRRTAEVVGTDPGSDIAVLRVTDGAPPQPLALADPNGTRVGEPVLAVGSPLGLSGTVTAGIVSALDREVRLGGQARQTAVQTDASINPGNSGGPLVNARGEVIGVNTAIATMEGGGSIGIGFAVPIERARQVADSLIARG
ncbi:trypsin-like peptidase domain-containing protein [Actinoplanes sp. LDG1-06]|uniref:Trypsin-like peptidase domain-containing protein n=1 Tax=Paractinoplanes ovalisporus TaxID=2810368 RepID=A0ABS2AIK1_9ACTN|nr:trypsin-like peptidase domain-containing protein [Actinoplanes ovalisporus]MBM2619610.1 trypsin-like peptidase domain-containing protein [Actinoplanes ovalisporus]